MATPTQHTDEGHEHAQGQTSCCGAHSHNGPEVDKGHEIGQDKPTAQATGLSSPAVGNHSLEQLKQEILRSVGKDGRAPLSWASVTVTAVLGLLALVSVVQAIQSASLYGKLKAGNLAPAAANAASGPAASLPAQVGGC